MAYKEVVRFSRAPVVHYGDRVTYRLQERQIDGSWRDISDFEMIVRQDSPTVAFRGVTPLTLSKAAKAGIEDGYAFLSERDHVLALQAVPLALLTNRTVFERPTGDVPNKVDVTPYKQHPLVRQSAQSANDHYATMEKRLAEERAAEEVAREREMDRLYARYLVDAEELHKRKEWTPPRVKGPQIVRL